MGGSQAVSLVIVDLLGGRQAAGEGRLSGH